MVKHNGKQLLSVIMVLTSVFYCQTARAWDHPGHMTTAAIAFAEIERLRPDLIDKIGLLLLANPDPAPFWVATGDAKGRERTRRMFIEAARWPDDSKFTSNDRPTWHSARWAIAAKDAPPEVLAAAKAHVDKPLGQALEALLMNFETMASPETSPAERSRALCWVLHIMGDIHQPLHVSDLYSKDFPVGNAAGTLSYVGDPLSTTTIPLHLLWDSNTHRLTALNEIDKNRDDFMKKYPRSSFPELTPFKGSAEFVKWAKEGNKIAADWAFDIQTVSDPNKDKDADRLVRNMVKFILEGISPVAEAPAVPDAYWKKLQLTAEQRITLAGYRIADLLIAAADQITAQQSFVGR